MRSQTTEVRLERSLLAGTKVVELGAAPAVGATGRILRLFGAAVSVPTGREEDGRPDIWRYLDYDKHVAPFEVGSVDAGDLDDCDVVLHAFQPRSGDYGALCQLDLLAARRPNVIITAVTPFGLTGPHAGRSADDASLAARSGLAHLTPRDIPFLGDERTQPPLKMPGMLISNYAGISAAVATVAALYADQCGSGGQTVDVSILESLIPTMRREVAYYAYEGTVASRFSRIWRLAPWGIKPCADGYVFIQVVERYHWEGLVEMMGRPAWSTDPTLLDSVTRYERRDEVDRRVGSWIRSQTVATLMDWATRLRLPFAPVNRPEHVLQSGQVGHRQFARRVGDDLALELPLLTRELS